MSTTHIESIGLDVLTFPDGDVRFSTLVYKMPGDVVASHDGFVFLIRKPRSGGLKGWLAVDVSNGERVEIEHDCRSWMRIGAVWDEKGFECAGHRQH